MKKQTIVFTNEDCSGIKMVNRDLFISFLHDFGPNVKMKLTIEHYFPQRSLKQNGALHWWFDLLAEALDCTPEYIKQRLAFKFLKFPVLDKNGEEVWDEETGELEMYIASTADLDKAQMVKFMDQVWHWGLTFANVELPQPDENYKLSFFKNHKQKIIDERNNGNVGQGDNQADQD